MIDFCKILSSVLICLVSFFLCFTNDINDVIVAAVFVAGAYNLLYSAIQNKYYSDKYINFIFSTSYFLSYLLIIWINHISINLGSEIFPYLPGDGQSYYRIGIELAETNKNLKDVSLNYIGYPLFLSFLFKILGSSLIFGLCSNMILLFLNIILLAKTNVLITDEDKTFKISFVLLLLTSQFVSTGFMLLKDGFIITAIALALYSSINIYNNRSVKLSCFLMLISILIMAVFRITFIWAPVLIFIIIILRNKNAKKYLPLSLLMLLVGIYLGKKYALNEISLDQSVYFVLSNKVITSRLDDTTSSFASFILSGYDNWSFSKKLLLLPVTTGIQYITPFDVYNIKYFLDYPYYLISKNYNLIWLILIGPLMLYSIGSIFNYRNRDIPLLSISVLGIVFYVIPAFVFGGAIPRYAVPYFSLLLPLMSLNYIQIQRDRFSQQKWRVFYLYYFLTFCFLLFVYLLFKILK